MGIKEAGDPKVACYPMIATVTDLVWNRGSLRSFVLGRLCFIFLPLMFGLLVPPGHGQWALGFLRVLPEE